MLAVKGTASEMSLSENKFPTRIIILDEFMLCSPTELVETCDGSLGALLS